MPDKTLPASVRTKALRCLARMQAWNQAVAEARSLDTAQGTPGKHEYRVRTDRAHIPLRLGWSQSAHALDLMEQTLRALGWAPQEFYAALGAARPEPEPQSPHLDLWREAQR